eukprot:COSAG01_NODE_4988_length_4567_cov_3.954790_5_plen_155_part_00
MATLLRLVGSEAYFTARQISLLMEMFSDWNYRVEVLACLMPRCVDLPNWNREVCDFLDEGHFRALDAKTGPLFYHAGRANATGRYRINLHHPAQRTLLGSLVEISIAERCARRDDDDGDGRPDAVNTSQKGDWCAPPPPAPFSPLLIADFHSRC